jgi:hypothetical protein
LSGHVEHGVKRGRNALAGAFRREQARFATRVLAAGMGRIHSGVSVFTTSAT